MELPIYTYGYAYHMFNTLNAIAMIRQSELYPAIIKTMALSVGVYYACKMALSQRDGEWRQYILKIIGMCFVINLLLMKSVTMVVHDNISKKILPVGNIPVVFALPIGMVEKFGHLVLPDNILFVWRKPSSFAACCGNIGSIKFCTI